MSKAKAKTAAQGRRWDALRELGCIVCGSFHGLTIHHCGTGGGGRKNHDKVIPLCHHHHQGVEGIDRKQGNCHTKRSWQEKYGSEDWLIERAQARLDGGWHAICGGDYGDE